MSEPDIRLVNVVHAALQVLDETPVLKLSRRVIALEVADAVWAWLAEGDELNPAGTRADQRTGYG